jgi:hypothetical protein
MIVSPAGLGTTVKINRITIRIFLNCFNQQDNDTSYGGKVVLQKEN